MEGSNGFVGVDNEACDVNDIDGAKGAKKEDISVVATEEVKETSAPKAATTKHARFKIINHSQSSQGLAVEGDNIDDVGEEKSDEYDEEDEVGEKKENLQVPNNYELTKRRQSEQHQSSHTHHDGLTIGYSSTEAIPMTAFYRNEHSLSNVGKKRPTLHELRKEIDPKLAKKKRTTNDASVTINVEDRTNAVVPRGNKIGWIKGVLFPCLLNIWGVIMFLRLSWIVGQAGIGLSSVIVLLSTAVTVVTALSMSAICTNGEVKGGGAYYLISRSLGPEFGGSIGIIFSIANAVAVSLYIVGFAETVRDLLVKYGTVMVDPSNDIRIIGICALVLLFIVALIGIEWVVYTQVFLLIILVASIISVVVGSIYPSPLTPRAQVEAYGIFGYNGTLFKQNFVPEYRDGNGFFSVFSIFFPAATGILAGANLSGDLKDPCMAVPKGTLMAIAITSCSYVIMCWLIGSTLARDASGIVAAVVANGSVPLNDTCVAGACKFGMMNDYQILEKQSIWGPIVTTGIFAATLSSALASLVSAPKVFQAVCKDNIFPGIALFGKGDDKNEPRRGYILAFFVGAGFIAIGDINLIAPIISNFFLMAYALINYSVFGVSVAKTPGWRPSFQYYNKWASLIGFFLCIAIMFLINWWAALITIISIVSLYKFVDFRRPDINWGSSGQAHTYMKALRFTRRLEHVEEHVKNFRVQCLVLSGAPSSRPNLVHFVSHITKHFGLMVCGEVVVTDTVHAPVKNEIDWLKKHRIKAFHEIVQSHTLYDGVSSLMQCTGLGKLRPNTLMLGYMSKWHASSKERIDSYVGVIHTAFDLHYGIAILRMQDGFDITEEDDTDDEPFFMNQEPDWYTEEWDESNIAKEPKAEQSSSSEGSDENPPKLSSNPEIVIAFDKKRRGTIDVWWLYDDGGLTILVPHLLSLSSYWRGCKLRIFTPASDKKIKANQIRMANLLKKFRIDFSSVVEFRGLNKNPSEESVQAFKGLIKGAHLPDDNSLDKKTLRQIRLGELVREHSYDAKLVVLTLPVPKTAVVTSLMYMSWLEVLSADLPPVLLIRGNQTSVLTFYS
eukprot:gene3336-3825_t